MLLFPRLNSSMRQLLQTYAQKLSGAKVRLLLEIRAGKTCLKGCVDKPGLPDKKKAARRAAPGRRTLFNEGGFGGLVYHGLRMLMDSQYRAGEEALRTMHAADIFLPGELPALKRLLLAKPERRKRTALKPHARPHKPDPRR